MLASVHPGPPSHPHTHSNVKKLVNGSFESQVRTGRTPLEMPSHPLAPLQSSVIASTTGPCAGLCQLQAELDTPTHESGSFVQPIGWGCGVAEKQNTCVHV